MEELEGGQPIFQRSVQLHGGLLRVRKVGAMAVARVGMVGLPWGRSRKD